MAFRWKQHVRCAKTHSFYSYIHFGWANSFFAVVCEWNFKCFGPADKLCGGLNKDTIFNRFDSQFDWWKTFIIMMIATANVRADFEFCIIELATFILDRISIQHIRLSFGLKRTTKSRTLFKPSHIAATNIPRAWKNSIQIYFKQKPKLID